MKQTSNKIMTGINIDPAFSTTVEKAFRRLNWGCVLFMVLLFPFTVSAASVHMPSISGLQIDKGIYNVEFAYGSFNTLFDSDGDRIFSEGDGSQFNHAPTFWGDQNGAMAAAQAIINELGTDSYILDYIGHLVDSFFVPYGDTGYGSIFLYTDYNSKMQTDTLYYDWYPGDSWTYLKPTAVFTKISTVPVPTSILLLASGILGIAGAIRRKK